MGDAIVLLDLLGADSPKFHHDKNFKGVNFLFDGFCEIERRREFSKYFKNKNTMYFSRRTIGQYNLGIDDDHMPFYRLGYDRIIHMIPVPFPSVWHKITDDESALDK